MRVIPPHINRKIIVFTNRPSKGGKTLASALNSRYAHSLRRRIVPISPTRGLVVNWGSISPIPESLAQAKKILNCPERVAIAGSKIESYRIWDSVGIPTVEWTQDYDQAMTWSNDGACVLSRRDRMSGGQGIYINPPNSTIRRSEFYTKYYSKTHEYRVHVFNERCIDFTQKRRLNNLNDDTRTTAQKMIRTLDNDWVHCHDNIYLRDDVLAMVLPACCGAIRSIGLDFGAVDLLLRVSKKEPTKILSFKIAEVNTSPGLGNAATIAAYRDALAVEHRNLVLGSRGVR